MMNSLEEAAPKTRRQYDLTFKLEAVQNWIKSGKPAAVVAEELGLSPDRLFAWRKLLPPGAAGGKAAPGGRPGPTDLQSQLDASQRELRHVREQVHILKKTLGILSEPSPTVSNGFRR